MPDYRNRWLAYAQRIQALARTGLTYASGEYDLERYRELEAISLQMLSDLSGQPPEDLKAILTIEEWYQTPKVDVRAVVFEEDRILLVREKTDQRWALPGGWGDIGYTPAEVAVKEVAEEAGLQVEAKRLLAVFDKKCHPHYPPEPHYCYKFFFLCEVTGGTPGSGLETLEVGYFGLDELPPLSTNRNTESQLRTLFELRTNPQQPALFD